MSIKKVPILEDFSWQLPVKDKDLSVPPASPAKGDRYIVAATGSGLWLNHTDDIALCTVGGVSPSWEFVTKVEGMITWVEDENLYYKYNGSAWGLLDLVKNDGTVNPTNLLTNGNFLIWSAGASVAPDGWSLGSGGEVVARESTTIKIGTYSCKLTSFGSDLGALYQYVETIAGINYWKGRIVTFGCWVYASTADRVKLRIYDGVTYTSSSYHTGDSTWQWLTVTKTLSAVATLFGAHFTIEAGTSISAYFDGAMLVEGESSFAFSDKPVILGNNSENIPTTFVGKVGIGTTTPGKILQVIGDCYFGDEANNHTALYMRRNAMSVGAVSSYGGLFTLFGGASPASHFYINSSGYICMPVGFLAVGTANFYSTLTLPAAGSISVDSIDGSDTGNLTLSGGGLAGEGRGATIQLDGNERGGNPGDIFINAGSVSGGNVRFMTGGVYDVMLIDENGNVGIGIDTPLAALHLLRSSVDNELRIENTNITDRSSVLGFRIKTGGSLREATIGLVGRSDFLITGAINRDLCIRNASNILMSASSGDTLDIFIAVTTGRVGLRTAAPTAQLDINSDIIRLRTSKTPATAGAAGNAGDICWDSSYIYVCVAASTWKRAALSTW